jgi:hypothetical protein
MYWKNNKGERKKFQESNKNENNVSEPLVYNKCSVEIKD